MVKKIDRLQKDNMILQHKVEEVTKKEVDDNKESDSPGTTPTYPVC